MKEHLFFIVKRNEASTQKRGQMQCFRKSMKKRNVQPGVYFRSRKVPPGQILLKEKMEGLSGVDKHGES
jgi:hypothetical protein